MVSLGKEKERGLLKSKHEHLNNTADTHHSSVVTHRSDAWAQNSSIYSMLWHLTRLISCSPVSDAVISLHSACRAGGGKPVNMKDKQLFKLLCCAENPLPHLVILDKNVRPCKSLLVQYYHQILYLNFLSTSFLSISPGFVLVLERSSQLRPHWSELMHVNFSVKKNYLLIILAIFTHKLRCIS